MGYVLPIFCSIILISSTSLTTILIGESLSFLIIPSYITYKIIKNNPGHKIYVVLFFVLYYSWRTINFV